MLRRLREWMVRLLTVGRRGRRDREFDDELRFHLDSLIAGHEALGLSRHEARQAAEREMGSLDRAKQAWRDQRTWPSLEELLQDARYGARVLLRSPGLTLIAGFTLALAVAATTSVFSTVDAILLAPLPYEHSEQLVVIFEEFLPQHAPNVSVASGNFLEWRDRAHSFLALTAIDTRQQNLTLDGDPLQVTTGAVSDGFAPTVARQPVVGRLFAADEFQPGHERVAVLGHALWISRYGADPGILGRTITLDDRSYTVVGVMPRGFLFPSPQHQLWVPLPMTTAERENRSGHSLLAAGRVRAGISVEVARRELHGVAEALRREYPASNRDWDVSVQPARDAMVGKASLVLTAMMGAVGLLLLVACANVAGLLLTHGLSRGREIAIRAALGASQSRVARQLLTEGALLALASGIAGAALAWAVQPLLGALRPADLLTWKPVAIDGRALLFALAVATISGTLFATIPALVASSRHIGGRASSRSAGRSASRTRQALVAFEVALAVVLVMGAALLGQTLRRLTSIDLGFTPERVVTMRVSLPFARYADSARIETFHGAIFSRIRALPDVRAAGAIHALPLSGNTSVRPYRIEGGPSGDDRPIAHYRIVTPGYLEAMRIPLRAGRTFTSLDTAGHPLAVIVNETLGRQAWGDRSAVGQRITFGGSNDLWAEVVGVVADVRHFGTASPTVAEMYWPSAQLGLVPGDTLSRMRRGLTLVVATEGNPLAVVPAVRAAVQAVDRDQPIATVRTMSSLMSNSLWLPRASAWLVTVFGFAALTFALVGIFGAASYAVTQRRRELAVRIALGAQPTAITRLVLVGALWGALAGIAAGVALSIALGKSVASLLVEIQPTDVATLVVVSAALVVATTLACWLPARRAARLDPMQILRTD